MRKFELSDVFKLSEIIDVMGIDLDLNEIVDTAQNKEGDLVEDVGAEIIFKLLKNLHKADQLVYEFIADITGDTIKEVKRYKPKKIMNFFTELFSDEDFADFFTQA